MTDKLNIKDAADAVKGIVEAVPIYEDLMQPAVKELGKGLHTLSKTIHIALSPISALVWGYEKIEQFIVQSLENRLKDTPKENIITPDPSIAGPTIESLRFVGHKEEIREMFANLLSTAMNSITSSKAHPSFVEIIRQITPDEAKIISYLGKSTYQPLLNLNRDVPGGIGEATVYRNFTLMGDIIDGLNKMLIPSYIDNLCRLGIINIPEDRHLTPESKYDSLKNHPTIQQLCSSLNQINATPIFVPRFFFLTDYGTQFYKACVE